MQILLELRELVLLKMKDHESTEPTLKNATVGVLLAEIGHWRGDSVCEKKSTDTPERRTGHKTATRN